jgi:EmrB/QacA subfamily drug resistance transporter
VPAAVVHTPHYGLTFATLVTAVLAYTLMQSMLAPALLTIQQDVHTTTTAVSWLLSGYLLVASVAAPILSRFGDIFGKRLLIVCVLGCFFAGTLICALSTSIEGLLLGRLTQGAGGALLPLAVGIIRDEFPPRRIVAGVAILSGVVGTGASLGFVLAGPITDHLSYHWLFWIPLVPIGVAGVACLLIVPESPRRDRVPIDWLGAILLAGWLVAVLLAVSQASSWGWGSPKVIGLFVLGGIGFAIWVAVELRMEHPLVDMEILRLRGVWTANAVAFLMTFALFTSFVLVPRLAETPASTGYGFGSSVTGGSLLLLPLTLAMLVMSMVVGRLLPRVGPKRFIVAGSGLAACAFVLLTFRHATPGQVALTSTLLGIGLGSAHSSIANQVIAWVPQTHTSGAMGMNSIVRFGGGAFGAQVSAAVLAATVTVSGFPSERGFEVTFAIAAGAAALGAALASLAPDRHGRYP